jgi:hypothetical protein
MVEALRSALPQHLHHRLASARDLTHRHSATPASLLPTTIDAFDDLLIGGLPRGQMLELVGDRSSGRFSILLAALAATTAVGEAAALVDLGSGLDPRLAAGAGVVLERLLQIRPEHLKQAVIGAEMLLAGGFPFVAVDLGDPPVPGGRGVEASWLRLARSAQSHNAALLISSPYRVSGTAATGVVKSTRGRARWSGTALAPPLLLGLSSRLSLEKMRGQTGTGSKTLRLVTPEAATFDAAETSGSPLRSARARVKLHSVSAPRPPQRHPLSAERDRPCEVPSVVERSE